MPMTVRDGVGTARNITAMAVRDGDGTLRTITEVRVRDTNNTSRTVFTTASPLTVSASPSYVFGTTLGGGTVGTNSTTATPSGGTAPYTYVWTVLAYDNPTPPTINNPTAATTTFTQTGVGLGESYSASFQIQVTDDNGQTAVDTVSASFTDVS